MASTIKVDTIETVAGSGNITLNGLHHLQVLVQLVVQLLLDHQVVLH